MYYLQAEGNTHQTGYDPKYHKMSEIMFKIKFPKKWNPIS